MLRPVGAVLVVDKTRCIEADTNALSDAMVKNNVSGSEIASRASRLDASMAPIVEQIEKELRRGVDSKRAAQFAERIVKDLPYLLNADIRSAQQTYWALNTLVSEVSQTASESARKEAGQVLESIKR